MSSEFKHKLEIFISSAMGDEEDTIWSEIRKDIRAHIDKIPFLMAYTIDEHATELSSTQEFLYHIESADVIVIIIKNTVRKGTKQEIDKAIEMKKPILLFFYNEGSPDSTVENLKKTFIEKDSVTFHHFKTFDGIEDTIIKSVMYNFVNVYKFYHHINIKNIDTSEDIQVVMDSHMEGNIDKQALSVFGEDGEITLGILGIEGYTNTDESAKNNNLLSYKLIEWAVKGTSFITEEQFLNLQMENNGLKEYVDVILLRFNAMTCYFDNQIEEAIKLEKEALQLAEKIGVPAWLIGDILIDCRNFTDKKELNDHGFHTLISKKSDIIHLPVGDRFVSEAFEELVKEQIIRVTDSRTTLRFGNKLATSIHLIEKYIFVGLLTGSATHLLVGRKKMAQLFFQYGQLYNDPELIFNAIKLNALSGDVKQVERAISSQWGILRNYLPSNVELLWELTSSRYCMNRGYMKCVIIKSLGQYMSNNLFMDATAFLNQFTQEADSHEKIEMVLKVMDLNMNRIQPELVLATIERVLSSDRLLFDYRKLTDILKKIELDKVELADLTNLNDMLKNNIDVILNNHGDPLFISNLMKQKVKIFNSLSIMIVRKMNNIQRAAYKVELAECNKDLLLSEAIKDARKFYDESKEASMEFTFRYEPLQTINGLIIHDFSLDFVDILNQEFITLAVEVLSNEGSNEYKEKYLRSLIAIVIKYNLEHIDIPECVNDMLKKNLIATNNSVNYMGHASSETVNYFLTTLKAVCNIEVTNELFQYCLTYKKGTSYERKIFAESIKNYVDYVINCKRNIEDFIKLIIIELLDDEYFVIREIALQSLLHLYGAVVEIEKAQIKPYLFKAVIDPSPHLKGQFIHLIGSVDIKDVDTVKELLDLFDNDASFSIRKSSKECREKMQAEVYE